MFSQRLCSVRTAGQTLLIVRFVLHFFVFRRPAFRRCISGGGRGMLVEYAASSRGDEARDGTFGSEAARKKRGVLDLVELPTGFEPATIGLKGRDTA